MALYEWEPCIGGVDFGEGPRWHEGRLWYSDFHQHSIYAVTPDGEREAIHTNLPDFPSGLGWMPDGSLLVVFMKQRRVMREIGGELVVHADLRDLTAWYCNDMVVDARGNAYVGNFGYDYWNQEPYRPADLVLVRADGSAETAATALEFPNGSVITPDGTTLIVGESFGAGYEAFTIAEDGSLTDRRRWADVPGASPDGCALDSDGAIWFSDARGQRVIRVKEGGDVTHTIETPEPTYASMLGGDDGRTLYALCGPASHHSLSAGKAAGVIYRMRVEHPHAGLP